MNIETMAGPDGTGRPLIQPIVVQVIATQSNDSDEHVHYGHRAARIFAAMQIVLGVLSVGLNVAQILVKEEIYVIGYGIWSPVLWFVAGGFGFASAHIKTTCMITTTMVMSILSATSTIYCLALTAMFLIMDQQNKYDYDYDDDDCFYNRHDKDCINPHWASWMALGSILLVVFVLEGIVAILAAVVCCRAVFCCKPIRANDQFVSVADLERQGVRVEAAPELVGASAVGSASESKEELGKYNRMVEESDQPPAYEHAAVRH